MNIELSRLSTATAVGLFSSTAFIGYSLSTPNAAIPALLLTPLGSEQTDSTTRKSRSANQPVTNPSHLIRQWKVIFEHGKKVGRISNWVSGLSWLYVAYNLPTGNVRPRSLYISGAILSMGVTPFTFIIMWNNVKELLRRAELAEKGQLLDEEQGLSDNSKPPTAELLREWTRLFIIRSFLSIAGLSCIVAANLSRSIN